MKNLLLLLLIIGCFACNKDNEDEEPQAGSKVEYRIKTSINGAIVKYINAQGIEENDFMNDSTTWVYTFDLENDLDSVGFKLKDYLNWATYKIIVNTDTVVNYAGPIPEGGAGGWYPIFYKF